MESVILCLAGAEIDPSVRSVTQHNKISNRSTCHCLRFRVVLVIFKPVARSKLVLITLSDVALIRNYTLSQCATSTDQGHSIYTFEKGMSRVVFC